MIIFDDVQAAANAVTERQLERAGKKLQAMGKNEKPVGTLHSVDARRLWVAFDLISSESHRLTADANTANSDHEEKTLKRQAFRKAVLAKLTILCFWYELRASMDAFSDTEDDMEVGIRQDWMVVYFKKTDSPLHALLGKFME